MSVASRFPDWMGGGRMVPVGEGEVVAATKGGLEDVVACVTEICAIDGDAGRLLYRGYDVADLAEHCSFEEVAHLLWHGGLPSPQAREALRDQLRGAASLAEPVRAFLAQLPRQRPMASLRTAVSALEVLDPQSCSGPEAGLDQAVRLTGQLAAVAAAWWRIGQGQEVLEPRPDLDHAAQFLYLLTGRVPDALAARAMNVAAVLHADHELNASTFAARVTAATLAGMHAAVTSAMGALEGPLHGGANEAAMHTVDEIGAPERAEAWIRSRLAAGQRIPGFGHRVYRTVDPRAVVLARWAQRLGAQTGDLRSYETTVAMDDAMRRLRGLYPNLDLYSGDVYRQLGIPNALFTPVFAVCRISGWTAHVLEQYAHNRLIRPRARYVGAEPRRLAEGSC